MKNGIWVSPDQFVQFAEKNDRMTDHIVTRDRSPDFTALGNYLPNPDPILRAKGKSVAIYRDLRGHPAVGGAIRRRKSAVTALEWGLDRGKATARTESNIQTILDDMDITQLIKDILEAPLYGYQPIEILWSKGQRWTAPEQLIAKPPEWFVFGTEGDLRFRSRKSMIEGEELSERKFLLPRNEATYQNPWGVADLAMVFWPATFMKGGLRFWVQFAEKYGTPWLVGKVPRNTQRNVKMDLADDLEAMIQDAIAVIPDDSSVDIIEAAAKTGAAEAYERLLMYCRSEINIALLGQNQTTESNSTNASATAGLEVADDLRDGDASLVESTVDQLIEWIMYANGMSGPAPKFTMYEQEEIDDRQAKRDEILSRTGVTFSKSYFMRSYDLEEDDIEDAAEPDPQQPAAPVPDVQFAESDPGDDISKRITDLTDQLQRDGEEPLKEWIDRVRRMSDQADSLTDLHNRLLNAYSELPDISMLSALQVAFTVAQARGVEDVAKEAGQGMVMFAEPGNPFYEQLAALQIRLRNLVPTERWSDMQRAGHDRSFVVAGAMKADLLNDLAGAVMTAIETGGSIDEFRRDFDQIVEKHGWAYTGEKNWRTRTIYATNMKSTYHAGRLAQLNDPELLKVAPLRMYRHGGSAEPRLEHLKWDKLTLPADHPWWQTHYTPNGWGCSCYVIAVSEATAKRMGGRFEDPVPDADGDIDEGWDYAPGASVTQELQQIASKKQINLAQTLAAAFKLALVREFGERFL
ncbi:MAG TPA: hypothetical protein DEA26_00685 [Oceanospirillales bacterium]|nr:hypothetical protein [Oceanospirillales bacterium]